MPTSLRILLLAIALSGCGWPFSRTYSGQVVDPDGKPIFGAVIASDRASTLSGEDGRFVLSDSGGTVTVRKIRYTPRTVDPSREPRLTLARASSPVRVGWDLRWQGPSMEGLISHLATHGFQIVPIQSGDLPEGLDCYVLPSPSWFTQEAFKSYLRASGAGAKLVVLGEWGGYDGIDLSACNALGSKAGISFAASAVRTYGTQEPEEWLTLKPVGPTSLGSGLSGIRLFTSGALDVRAPGIPLVQTGSEGVRIQAWSMGAQTIAAAGPLGRGSLLALSDTSLFTDEANPDGSPHWKSLDNPAFAVNLLNW